MMYTKIVYFVIVLLPKIQSYTDEVKVSQGKIIGSRGATVFDGRLYYAFYGIPYAQPPVGKLRFRDPKPPKKWNSTFDARTEFHGACAQAHILHKHAVYGVEDCLTLNIYTPQLPRKTNDNLKAVIVYVHGYAFASSFSHIYGADFFMENDVVFVTVSYRIGAFGFLKIKDSDIHVNMGLKDIVMALKWIKVNIKKFNGNKNNVTVMGSGSAGTFLSLLLMTNHRKLFSKMILHSGTLFSPSLFIGNHSFERDKLLRELKIKGDNDIMKASVNNIIAASQKIYGNIDLINIQRPLVPFTPIIEKNINNSLLFRYPHSFYEYGIKNNISIPMLIGFNSRESIAEIMPFLHNPKLLKSFEPFFKFMIPFSDGRQFKYTAKIYQLIAEKIKNHYFKEGFSEKAVNDFAVYTSDLIKYPIYQFIKEYIKLQNRKIYAYKFNYVGNFNAVRTTAIAGAKVKVKGASYGDELCYVLKCEPLWETYVKVNDTDRDKKLIRELSKMWTNFVKFGDPTPPGYLGNFTWPPMTREENYMLLVSHVKKVIRSNMEDKMFTFWNDLFKEYYSQEHYTQSTRDEL